MTKMPARLRDIPDPAPDPAQIEIELRLGIADDEAECLRVLLEARIEEAAGLQSQLSAFRAERDALRERLAMVTSSASWRVTSPARRFGERFPTATLLAKRVLKAIPRPLTPQLLSKWRERPAEPQMPPPASPGPQGASLASEAPFGWYGARPLRPDELSPAFSPDLTSLAQYRQQTEAISHRFGHRVEPDGSEGLHRAMNSAALARDYLASVESSVGEPSERPARYTIVTPFFRHLPFFRLCAQSVALLSERLGPADERLEWIVVNDDPAVSADDLEAAVPAALRPRTKILSDGGNRGIVDRLNQGIAEARFQWILFLDCDDEIDPAAIDVLDHYIALFPQCRYIASAMTDIDEQGRAMRPRIHEHPTTELFAHGMVASHLKAIRRDLLRALGGLDPAFSGVQDYDFAFRAASREALLQIPERLYRYRWHDASQTVAKQRFQAVLAKAARARFLRSIIGPTRARAE